MGKFHDLLQSVADSGEGYGDSFGDDAIAAYDEDFSTAQAAIVERDGQIAALTQAAADNDAAFTSQLNAAKAANWDLAQQLGASTDNADDTAVVVDDADIRPEDLFED